MGEEHPSGDAIGHAAIAKASWRILPLVGFGYLFALMDRINVSFAALRMNQDLGFSATVYGLGAGLFFLAYALFEVPSNIFLTRFGARRWLARIMITWGLIAAGTMFVTSARQFYFMRFLLGTAEAGFFPGVVYYLAHWFPRAHRGRAISRFYLCGPLSVVVIGSLSGWLLSLDGTAGVHGWQWLFLVQGLPATLIGLLILFRLPAAPAEVGWLTSEERAWLERELAVDAARLGEPAEHGMIAALSHPLVVQLGLIGFLTIGAMITFTLSAPLFLEQATSLNATGIGWLAAIGGVLGAIGMLFSGAYSDRHGRAVHDLACQYRAYGTCVPHAGNRYEPEHRDGRLSSVRCNVGSGHVVTGNDMA